MRTNPMNPTLHPAILPYLTAHYAMEPRAQGQWLQRLLSVSPEAKLPTPQEIKARAEAKRTQARAFGFMDWDDDDDDEDYPSNSSSSKPYQISSGVAVLPLLGCLQPREDWITWLFPDEATALETFVANLQAAAADVDVTGILLYVDSPGGLVSGTPEAADAVYALRQGKKPVTAYAPSQCCSAAYWIASQAAEFYCGDTAWLGSIGTRLDLVDSVEFYAKLGLKVEPITTGTFKASGADGTTITDDDRAYYQSLLDRVQVEFTAGVARGRKLKIDAARALSREARIYVGGDAVGAGLADALRNAPEVLMSLQQAGATAKAGAASSSGASASGRPAAQSGNEEGSSMNRIESFVAWLTGASNDAGGAPPGAEPNTTAQNGAALQPGAAPADSGAGTPAAQPAMAAGALAPHPLVTACTAAGLTTPEQVQGAAAAVTERTALQAKLKTRLQADAKRLAVMASGMDMAATVNSLPDIPALEAFISDCQAKVDGKYGITATTPASRQSQAQDPASGAEGQAGGIGVPVIKSSDYFEKMRSAEGAGKGR